MKDEIKEILDILKRLNNEYSLNSILDFEEYEISNMQLKQLLDYITNLQTIEREYSFLLSKNAELENKIINLQEESERLKADYGTKAQIERDTYKTRIDKAIEKLKDLYSYADNEEYVDNYCKVLLNILQGKSDE